MEPRHADRKRLAPDRFRRIWALVETIEREPGMSRGELARRFSLSERQLQADLIVIRDDIQLPLVRLGGYRFVGTPPADERLGLSDALSLHQIMMRAAAGAGLDDVLIEMGHRLPLAFPPSIRPLVAEMLAVDHDGYGPGPETYALLVGALLEQRALKLTYARHAGIGYLTEPIVRPEIVLPYRESWYLIGECAQLRRVVMLRLDGLEGVSLEEERRP